MPLVDYSSSSSSSPSDSGSADDPVAPPAKRRKPSADPDRRHAAQDAVDGETPSHKTNTKDKQKQQKKQTKTPGSDLPPLPDAFHDLYASTVRHSVADDPALHHGRKRQIPHVVGKWPSHLYVEWHPTTPEHDSLVELLAAIQEVLGEATQLNSFLTSDLGAPLPLHISLSRPIALTTGEKDTFLDKVASSVKASGISAFAVSPDGLAWHKSPDSARAFLVLRVTAHDPASSSGSTKEPSQAPVSNPQLRTILTRCNSVVASFGQPKLYQQHAAEQVDDAFHVSIAWTFDLPDEEACRRTCTVLGESRFIGTRRWKIPVTGVKAKIGNVVTHVPLGGGKGLDQADGEGLF